MSQLPDLVIANGTVVNSFGRQSAHVIVDGGKVTALPDVTEPVPAAVRTVDAAGMLVIPGGVDGHCHVAQVTGRFRTLDDYATTTPHVNNQRSFSVVAWAKLPKAKPTHAAVIATQTGSVSSPYTVHFSPRLVRFSAGSTASKS